MIPDREMAALLLEALLIDRPRLDEALALQKRHGGELYTVAIENGLVDEERTIRLVAQKLNLQCVSLRSFEADPELLQLVPAALAARHRVVPVGLGEDNSLYLAMANPIDFDAMEEVGQRAGHDVIALLAGPLDVDRTLERIYEPEARPAAASLGGLFMAARSPQPMDDDLEDVVDLPSMDGDLEEIEDLEPDDLVLRGQRVEADDLLDLYGAPAASMFMEQHDAFVSHEGLSAEGRKRLEEAAQVEDLEIARPSKGKTAAFRGWDDDDDDQPAPQTIDRGLFASTLPQVAAPPTPATPAPPRRALPKREIGAAPPPTPPAPAPLPTAPPPPTPPSRPSPAPRPGARIGAAVSEVPQQAGARRMGRTANTPAAPSLEDSLQGVEAREIVLGLVRALLKRGILTEKELLAELNAPTS